MSDSNPIEITDAILEFYECLVHTILKARRVYPSSLFTQRFKYNISIWQCIHPEINSYVHRVILNCRDLISSGLLSRLIIISKSPDDTTVVDMMSLAATFHYRANDSFQPEANHFYLLEEEFRSAILKASMLDTLMETFTEGESL